MGWLKASTDSVRSLPLSVFSNQVRPAERPGYRTPTLRWGLLRADRLQKPRQLRRCLVLRNRLQLLEGTGEGVREAPHGPRLELVMRGLKVEIVDPPGQVLRKSRFVLDERLVDQQLCRSR